MSKGVVNVYGNNDTASCPLSNGLEVNQVAETSLCLQDKELCEEGAQYSIAETSIGCRVIALRLQHLEQGQKKILRTIAGLNTIVQIEKMAQNRRGKVFSCFISINCLCSPM